MFVPPPLPLPPKSPFVSVVSCMHLYLCIFVCSSPCPPLLGSVKKKRVARVVPNTYIYILYNISAYHPRPWVKQRRRASQTSPEAAAVWSLLPTPSTWSLKHAHSTATGHHHAKFAFIYLLIYLLKAQLAQSTPHGHSSLFTSSNLACLFVY